jgi:Na+-translocating ferredoxin:NAD+ oxidoreductase RnfE subunit
MRYVIIIVASFFLACAPKVELIRMDLEPWSRQLWEQKVFIPLIIENYDQDLIRIEPYEGKNGVLLEIDSFQSITHQPKTGNKNLLMD